MKKTIISTIIIILVFLSGIWIGKTQFQKKSVPENQITEEIDTAQVNLQKIWEEKYPIYAVAGGLPDPADKYRYIVDSWYGFTFTVNGNCTTQYAVDANRNNKTDSILKKRIGKDWHERFEKTVDSLYRIDTLAISIAENDSSVQNLIKLKAKENPLDFYPGYKCYAAPQKNFRIVSITCNDRIYNDTINVSFMRVAVDISKKKVTKIEDTPMEWDFLGF